MRPICFIPVLKTENVYDMDYKEYLEEFKKIM